MTDEVGSNVLLEHGFGIRQPCLAEISRRIEHLLVTAHGFVVVHRQPYIGAQVGVGGELRQVVEEVFFQFAQRKVEMFQQGGIDRSGLGFTVDGFNIAVEVGKVLPAP